MRIPRTHVSGPVGAHSPSNGPVAIYPKGVIVEHRKSRACVPLYLQLPQTSPFPHEFQNAFHNPTSTASQAGVLGIVAAGLAFHQAVDTVETDTI